MFYNKTFWKIPFKNGENRIEIQSVILMFLKQTHKQTQFDYMILEVKILFVLIFRTRYSKKNTTLGTYALIQVVRVVR